MNIFRPTNKIPYLRFKETVPTQNPNFHIVRHVFKPKTRFFLHSHRDFAEIFWIESGSGLHLINGKKMLLKRGTLVMIRPQDIHGFEADRSASFTLVNLSFRSKILNEWKQRYFLKKNVFFWNKLPLPHEQEINSEQILRLQKWCEYLSSCPNHRFHFDWFLMDLLHSLLPHERMDEFNNSLPVHLSQALTLIQEPQHFIQGPRHLAKLSNYSLQHLNRILKRGIGHSAGEVVNQARLDYAVRQLQLSNQKILEICLDCGFNNLGYFYNIFKKRFGMTPRKFRLTQQLVIGQRA